MNRHSAAIAVLIALIILGALSGILGNIAADNLPEPWKPYVWLAWPFLGATIIALIILEITYRRFDGNPQSERGHGNMNLPTSSQEPSTSEIQILHEKMTARAKLSDLRDICFYLDISDQNYPVGRDEFVRMLLEDLRAQGRVNELKNVLQNKKPWILRE